MRPYPLGVADAYYAMSPTEIAWGYVFGHVATSVSSSMRIEPRAALERAVLPALLRPPCGVAFSGGRDSSTVLAIATHVARREGLPEPIPVTRVFPEAPASDEHVWQTQVVQHLGLSDWSRLVLHDDLDLVGPLATARLLEHGVLWPPLLHADIPILEVLRGGSLIDGEGGDEVLGIRSHRVAPVTGLVRSTRPIQVPRIVAAAEALAPASYRSKRVVRRFLADSPSWLRAPASEALAAMLGAQEADRPLSFSASVRMVPRRRSQVLMGANRRLLGRSVDVVTSSPLLDVDFVDALAVDGGRLGRAGRTGVLRALVPDLLPDAVLARMSKATFGEAYMGRHTQDFAAQWSGGGVDAELVDPIELKRLWECESRIGLTSALLQSAWLGSGTTLGVEQ